MNLFRKLLVCLALFASAAQAAPATTPAPANFILGIVPAFSARVLTERYEPLRAYLEKVLKQPVRIESAPDFRRFQQRTLHGDFDLTITPAHFARMAQKEVGLQPLAQFSPDHDTLLIYAADRPLANFNALKGKQLAVIDRLAITVMAALQFLDTQGLEADQDFKVVEHRTHASAAYSLLSGLSAAAVTTSQGLLQMPDDLRNKLIVQKHIADIPAWVLIAKASMDKAQAELVKKSLLAFPNTEEGIDFLGRTGYTSLIPANESVMKRADIYLKETRKALK
jgi:phosphonate transport system substrate-binding protein